MMFLRTSLVCLGFAMAYMPASGGARRARAEQTHTLVASAGIAKAGQPRPLGLTIEGRNGWHINAEAPISLKLAPPPGVELAKTKLGRGDLAEATDTRARFEVQATCSDPSVQTITAEASFVMCQDTACKPVKETVALTCSAEAATTPNPSNADKRAKRGKAVKKGT